jgi:hypothetical protein
MFIVRLLAIIVVAAIVANLVAWLFTRDERYLSWAVRLGKFTLAAVVVLLVLLVGERLIVL